LSIYNDKIGHRDWLIVRVGW